MSEERIAVPPTGDRINYYLTGRVRPQYRPWAERDLSSPKWARREWIRVVILVVVYWAVFVRELPPLRWPLVVFAGLVVLVNAGTSRWLRRAALNRVRRQPLPAPTATGLPSVSQGQASAVERPDPAQAFYSRRKKTQLHS